MGESIFISICIPAYQRTGLLKRLLDSVHTQIYQDFEVLITDDSPGSEVQELVEQHALRPKIRYFKNERIFGTPENWNECLRRAESGWVKIMHDDDWFSGPDSLGLFADAIREGNHDFYFSAYSNVYSDGNIKPVQISDSQLNALQRDPVVLLAANRVGPPSAVIFKKDLSILFDNRMRWLVDIDFYIRYLNNHPQAIFINRNLVRIGISDTQVTRSSFGNRKIEIPERFLLLEKLNPKSLNNLMVFDSWWRFIRNMQIRDENEIRENGYRGPVPGAIGSMIRFQKNIPASLLKIGIFSKMVMFVHYLSFTRTK